MTIDVSDQPTAYMARTRDYYRALGYAPDYVWAKHGDVPFARLSKPLRESRIALITTAGPADRSHRDARGRKHVSSGAIAGAPRVFDTDVAWDRDCTHTGDRETYLPIDAATRLAGKGLFAGLTARFHGAPTDYSHRKTNEQDAPELLRRLAEDGADAALLTAL